MNYNPIKDPANYRWFFFYFNPLDQRIFVPKRIGWGYTLNFSKVSSYVILLVLILLIFLAKNYIN